ncbi:MAG: hypothetical protein RR197_00520 [Oscillospiraceae bacterium]
MRTKNLFSFLHYGIRYRRLHVISFLINMALLVVALVHIRDILAVGSLLVLLVTLFTNIIWQFMGTFSELYHYFGTIAADEKKMEIAFDRIEISEKERLLGYQKQIIGANGALYSAQVNDFLQTSNPACVRSLSKEKQLKSYISRHFDTLYLFLKCRIQTANAHKKNFSNQQKLCLCEDLDFNRPVSFCKSCYYDTHVTNKIYFLYLFDDGETIESPLFIEHGDRLPDLSTSMMSNEIGVSTLGITNDGYLVLLQQNTRANSSSGLLVPTGSGSADWADYHPGNFRDTIVGATNRELYEEIGRPKGFTAESVGTTKLLGFFRWINFGGKPEFLSLTRMNVSVCDISPEKKEQAPNRQPVLWVDFAHRQLYDQAICSLVEESIANSNCSFPLAMNLLCFKEYYTQSKTELEAFLFGAELPLNLRGGHAENHVASRSEF